MPLPSSPLPPPQATGFAMPLQDAVTGRGILNLRRGPLPKPVPLVTVVGAPIQLPPFEGAGGRAAAGWLELHSALRCGQQVAHPTPPPSAAAHAGDLRSEAGRAHVDACHARYCAALQALWDAHKDAYAPNRKQEMRFVE